MEIMMIASEYLRFADSALDRAHHHSGDLERARLNTAEAQVVAIQAVAAALDRIAEALEAQSR
jgi:hypothetical protein